MKTAITSIFVALFLVGINGLAWLADELVEVMLADKLDEARGYCLDIAGGQGKNAPLDKGMQAHTCYHYKGVILEDQGFDVALISEGEFRIVYFDVCMSVPSIEVGSAISLGKCKDLDTQKFTLKPNGQLVAKADPKLCVTVSSTEKKEGRGGSPVRCDLCLSSRAMTLVSPIRLGRLTDYRHSKYRPTT